MGRPFLERISVLAAWGMLLVATNGCDPVWKLEGHVQSAAHERQSCPVNDIDDAQVSIRCPSGRGNAVVRTTRLGYFMYGKIDNRSYEDDCVVHVEKAGFKTADVTIQRAKVGTGMQPVSIVIPLVPANEVVAP
jgi:hypothetical protein